MAKIADGLEFSEQAVNLGSDTWETVWQDVCQRRKIEACGALLGDVDEAGNWHVTRAIPLRNTASSPVYFEFDPLELLNIDLAHPGEMIGVYHSHPGGYGRASDTDRANMRRVNLEQRIPWVWLIVCGPFPARPSKPASDTPTLLAYHHSADHGLQHVAVHLQ